MFTTPGETQFDLRFRLLGVDVRVHPAFWIISAALGWDLVKEGFDLLFYWVLCVFVSVLLHEMGHVMMGRLFGSSGHIVLYSFGGLAIGSTTEARRWQRVLVLFAGPGIQLLLYGLIYKLLQSHAIRFDAVPRLGQYSIAFLIEINLFWALLNLLPIYPLDGGQISREFIEWLSPGNGFRFALGVSMLVAGALCLNALVGDRREGFIPCAPTGTYMAIFFGLFAFTNFQALQQADHRDRYWQSHEPEDRNYWR